MKQAALLIGAVVSLTMALVLLIQAGLPERASFSGQILPGERPIAPELDATAPPFQLPTLHGASINVLDLRGQPVVINFWATWCGPCRDEMPELQAIYDEYGDNRLRVLAINQGESSDIVADWVETLGLTFDILLDEREGVGALYRLRGMPSTFVIAPTGVISQIFYGPTSQRALQAALAPYFSA